MVGKVAGTSEDQITAREIMDHYILDENDCPRLATFEQYHAWQRSLPEDIKTSLGFKLARTEENDVLVSTVYLGLDHAFDSGPPMLWETMVFCAGEENNYCERAATRKQALENHEKYVRKYIQKIEPNGS